MDNVHVPVLLEQITRLIRAEYGGGPLTVFDGTLGGGGYSAAFLEVGYTVYGSDLDAGVVQALGERFADKKFEARQGNFSEVITEFADGFFNVVVVDLGYSSNQLESSGRGFSYLQGQDDLDLRYATDRGHPAYELVDSLGENELQKLIYRHSGEALSLRIARSLKEQPVRTVGETVAAVERAIPAKFYKKRNAILSRVWQALRIEVNEEFEHLQLFLERSVEKLKPGGLLMVVDFHSLEDKLVTKFMREKAKPVAEDVYGNRTYAYRLMTKKGILPSQEEITQNIRSRSATLRVLKRL